MQTQQRADRVFGALSDGTRRDILRRVLTTEQSVSALARHYPISLTAVQKHVGVLERADLVTKRRQGREQLVSGRPDTLAQARQLLDRLEHSWRERLDRFETVLAESLQTPSPPEKRHP
jgi:DNA-binding transcriptional ArsR family regulator